MQDIRKKLQLSLAKIVKDLRLSTHKSVSLISNEVNLSKSIWSDLEKGIKDPQLSTLWRVAEALDIPLSRLIMLLEDATDGKINFIEDSSK